MSDPSTNNNDDINKDNKDDKENPPQPKARRTRRNDPAAQKNKYILGHTQELVVPPPPPPSVQSTPSSDSSSSSSSSSPSLSSSSSASSPANSRVSLGYWLSIIVALLLTGNSLQFFPDLSNSDRKPLMITYLGTLFITLMIMQRSKFTALWQVALSVFLWIGSVELCNIYLGMSSFNTSNILKITGISFALEFIVAKVLSSGLVKGLLGLVAGSTVWMGRNMVRLALSTLLSISIPSILSPLSIAPSSGVTSFFDLPSWALSGAGVVLWAWLSLLVASRAAGKLV